MNYFPVFLDAHKIHALVVGGGNVAARKIELLLKTPAHISIVSDKLNPTVERLVDEHNLSYVNSVYQVEHLVDKSLVIAATNNNQINKQIANDAQKLNLLINVVDSPDLCNYITPAIIDRSPMVIALSSEGSAPILLQMLRNQIEVTLPAAYGELAKFCKSKRDLVQQEISQFAQRKLFWRQILEGEVAELIIAGQHNAAERLFDNALYKEEITKHGKLNIITLNNNNPDNLTLRAFQALQSSDDIYLCSGIGDAFYDYARRDADKYHQLNAEQISKKLFTNRQVSILRLKQTSASIDFIKDALTDFSNIEYFTGGD